MGSKKDQLLAKSDQILSSLGKGSKRSIKGWAKCWGSKESLRCMCILARTICWMLKVKEIQKVSSTRSTGVVLSKIVQTTAGYCWSSQNEGLKETWSCFQQARELGSAVTWSNKDLSSVLPFRSSSKLLLSARIWTPSGQSSLICHCTSSSGLKTRFSL